MLIMILSLSLDVQTNHFEGLKIRVKNGQGFSYYKGKSYK